jgi:hypothetical protein
MPTSPLVIFKYNFSENKWIVFSELTELRSIPTYCFINLNAMYITMARIGPPVDGIWNANYKVDMETGDFERIADLPNRINQSAKINVGNYMFPRLGGAKIPAESADGSLVDVFSRINSTSSRCHMSWMCKLVFPEIYETTFIEKVKVIND